MADLIHLAQADLPHDNQVSTPGGGGTGGGTSQKLFTGAGNDSGVPSAGDAREHVETLVNLIRQAVTPQAWQANSGNALAVLDDVLVITAPDTTQRATSDLLSGLRKASGRTAVVRVDAQWLLLMPTEMAAHRDGPPPADPAALHAQSRTVGFNGQSVTVTATRTTTVVKSTTPVVAPARWPTT